MFLCVCVCVCVCVSLVWMSSLLWALQTNFISSPLNAIQTLTKTGQLLIWELCAHRELRAQFFFVLPD